jgi:predicted Zn-dependent peptidase
MIIHTLENGLTILIEPMAGVASAAMSLLIPCGVATDPADQQGAACVLQELTLRGAGNRSSRALSDDLDRLGIQRSSSVGIYHARYGAAATADNLLAALPIYAEIVQRPTLAAEEFEPAQQLSLQSLDGLDDDPRGKVLIETRKAHWPDPLGRNAMGEVEHLKKLDIHAMRTEFARRYTPSGTILAIAGAVDPRIVIERVTAAFGNWKAVPEVKIHTADSVSPIRFMKQESEQTHIGIACPSTVETDPDYYVARIAAEILSGGSGGRLFTEIREKRGLCYSVGTSYAALRDRASLLGYAGTSNDRAQATLDAFIEELKKLQQGVKYDEVERSKVGLLSNTVMSSESTGARAGAIAADFFTRGRLRPMGEIIQAISSVTHEQVNNFVKNTPLGPFTVVIVGPKELTA